VHRHYSEPGVDSNQLGLLYRRYQFGGEKDESCDFAAYPAYMVNWWATENVLCLVFIRYRDWMTN
jgi:hypothetical protein